MKKIKKFLSGLVANFTIMFYAGINKVLASESIISIPQKLYGPPPDEETKIQIENVSKTPSLFIILLPIIIFFIGLMTILNKKIGKKTKIILFIILNLILIFAIGYIFTRFI